MNVKEAFKPQLDSGATKLFYIAQTTHLEVLTTTEAELDDLATRFVVHEKPFDVGSQIPRLVKKV